MPINGQPGGIWCGVDDKALSYCWVNNSGFTGALVHTAQAGGLSRTVISSALPFVTAIPKSSHEPYMSGGGGIGDAIKGISPISESNQIHPDQSAESLASSNPYLRPAPPITDQIYGVHRHHHKRRHRFNAGIF
jgi:hypothetical protein